MKNSFLKFTACLLLMFSIVLGEDTAERKRVSEHLQNISVTIKSQGEYSSSEGSGVLIVREVKGEQVTFVWTAAHVIDNLRTVREVINEEGQARKVVEFKDAQIVKELVENGRRVGEIKMDAVVVKYSDADDGHDLALLMVRAKNYGKGSALFFLNKKDPIVPIGTPLYHVGSLLGQMGANSMTSGIISQVGRTSGKVEFDQTTVTAFPGSSGGGVFLQDGRYIGMLVRGAGEGFNLVVPVRRMMDWAKSTDLLWALDPELEVPTLAKIEAISVEDAGLKKKGGKKHNTKEFPFLIKTTTTPDLPSRAD
tara:strand:+ start:344 stop:1270 length:927 start_codon:yes stop_codon:yes gene_type:complete